MEHIEIKPGDQFLYRTKYGGKVIATIRSIVHITSVDADAGVTTYDYRLFTTEGVAYSLREVEIIKSVMTPDEKKDWERRMEMMKRVADRKSGFIDKIKKENPGS